MRRLCIFVFYDKDGKVERYVEYLLSSVLNVSEQIIIVANCILDANAKKQLSRYAKQIYERENKGFDAGAYKFLFTKKITPEYLEQFDEIMMINDTFYGPIYSWDKIFDKMDNIQIDYWGLTANDNVLIEGIKYPRHIQSYFLVLKKRIYLNKSFYDFWLNMKDVITLKDAILEFEIGLANWMNNNGYIGKSYLDIVGEAYVEGKNNPYSEYAYEILTDCGIPIVKRKVLYYTLNSYEKVDRLLDYIDKYTNYNVDMINENLERIYGEKYRELMDFCRNKKRLYVYGAGKIGNNLMNLIKNWGFSNSSFIVSEKAEPNIKVINEINFEKKDGIIIGVGEKLADELYENAKKYIGEADIFNIWGNR